MQKQTTPEEQTAQQVSMIEWNLLEYQRGSTGEDYLAHANRHFDVIVELSKHIRASRTNSQNARAKGKVVSV